MRLLCERSPLLSSFSLYFCIYFVLSHPQIAWLEQLRDSQQKFQEKLKAKLQSSETTSPQTNKHSKLLTKIQRMHAHKHEVQHREASNTSEQVTASSDGLYSLTSSHLGSNSIDNDSADALASSPGGLRTSNSTSESRAERPNAFSTDDSFHPTPQSSGDSGLSSHSQDHSYLVNIHGTFSPPLSPTLHANMPPFDQSYDPHPPQPRSRSTSQSVTVSGAAALGESLEVMTPRTPKRVSIAPEADEIIPPYIIERGENNEEDGEQVPSDVSVWWDDAVRFAR